MVAVKLLLLGAKASLEAVRRLRGEALAAAALKHPNIVAIHDVGVDHGQHFLAMDLVEGLNLAQLVLDRPIPSITTAVYARKVAAAIQHAHERGILHRDLKPANVLVDREDEPHVTDFGLAKRLTDDVSLTDTGQVLGSPNYMAPEQARADAKLTAACDIYGLGGVLYYLLTGRAPIHGENVPDTIRRVVESDPIAPRLLNPAVAPDLETICLKCLEKEPTKRYRSAREVLEELDRFLRNEPIKARPLNALTRGVRWARRHRVQSLALFALAGVAVGSPLVVLKISRERQRAEEQLYTSNISLGLQAVEASHFLSAREALRNIESSGTQKGMMGWEAWYLREQCRAADVIPLGKLDALPASIAFTPDDKMVGSIIEDGTVQLWDLELRRSIASWQAHKRPSRSRPWRPHHALVFDKQGRLFTGGVDGGLRAWNVVTQPPVCAAELGNPIGSMSVSPDGRILIATTLTGTIAAFKIEATVTPYCRWQVEPGHVYRAVFLPDAEHAMISAGRTLQQWKLPGDSGKPSLVRSIEQATDLAVAPKGDLLASQGVNAGVRIWQLPTFNEIQGSATTGGSLGISPDGDVLAVGSGDGRLSLVDPRSGLLLRALQGHTEEIRALAFSHDGKFLVSGGCDQMLGLWDITALLRPKPTLRHGQKVQDIRFLRDSTRFLTLGRELRTNQQGGLVEFSTVKLWHTARETELATATLARGSILHNRLALAPDDGNVAVNDFGTGQILSLPSLQMRINPLGQNLDYSADGQRVVFFNRRQIGRAGGKLDSPLLLGTEDSDISTLVVSPDGKTAISRVHESEGEFSFWDVERPGSRVIAAEHRQTTVQFAFSPDGKLLATASWDGTVGLWDVASRQNITRLRGHADAVDAVAFSPDGRTLATGAQDRTVRLWHVGMRRQIASITVEEHGVSALAFSPDGQWLVGGGFNGTLHLWRAPRDRPN
jgi:WD40 repeat protein